MVEFFNNISLKFSAGFRHMYSMHVREAQNLEGAKFKCKVAKKLSKFSYVCYKICMQTNYLDTTLSGKKI